MSTFASDLGPMVNETAPRQESLVSTRDPRRYIGICSQTVGIGETASVPMLARISLIDYRGQTVYDVFVQPTHSVTDYHHETTGLDANHLASGIPFQLVQETVAQIIRGKILVGYRIWLDLSVLGLQHPAVDTRDTALFLPLRRSIGSINEIPSLANLVGRFLRRRLGFGYQHPLEDARAAVDLFRSCEEQWETYIEAGQWPCALPPVNYESYFC
ncbi:hypothetical protein SISSUDRAFT_1019342 [Sistotremastrum suecicum HHB10207 ss-3]|uniref:Exonuclease domain-containing protein n=1 Tax=Sistotremastrum suecicum HHB10207 ss-3 TaxID=1314776 RepID=A0A166EZI4_9AGAM|nr:hypothetical protein SISSUDRAFT_1019342 [Sistotremastrum suecicum HHB10207 ss-3]